MHTSEATMGLDKQDITIVKKPMLLGIVICSLAAMFYMYEFVLQVSPAVMTSELMHDFGLNAASLGAVSAFYYYAYTPMQLPAGLLYDRFGPRLLLTLAVLICALGAFFFGLTNSAAMASAGRFFMGIGSAFSFIGALLLISRWFPPSYFAVLAGLVQFMSSIGAISGQVPLAAAVAEWGWRHTTLWLSVFGVVLSVIIWLIVRDSPEEVYQGKKAEHHINKGELKRLQQVCHNKQTWLTALYSFSVWAPIAAFAALWGVPFLVSAYGMSTHGASEAIAMIWLGIGIGSPLAGWWSDHIGRRCLPLTACALLGVFALTSVVYIPHLSKAVLYVALFIFGMAASGQALSFAVVKDNNHPGVTGTAIGFNNMATVAGGALFQPLVGILLHVNWDGAMQGQSPVYNANDYRLAFIVLPLCYVFGGVISAILMKETFCKPQYKTH